MREKYEKVKTHLSENKKVYLAAGGGVVVGSTVTFLVGADTRQIVKVKQFMGIGYKCSQTATTIVLHAKGDPGDVVMRLSDEKKWPSKGELARDLKIARPIVSKYFAGDLPDLNGEHYVVLGKAGHTLVVPAA